MQRLNRVGGLAAGTTLGGLVVGAAEAAYRDVELVYAALLYGALWAIAGGLLALVVAGLFRRTPPGLITSGAALALGASVFILTRFILFRDVYHEAPDKSLTALGLAVAAGVAAVVPVLWLSNWVRQRFVSRGARSSVWWVVPLSALAAFGIAAVTGRDDGLATAPDAHTLSGKGVILVVVDALRADMLGAYGGSAHRGAAPSPAFDAWAAGGARYSDMSAQASWTKAAVASIMTSRHPTGHDTMSKVAVLPPSLPTVASVLADAGVKTGAVVTNYNLEEGYGFDHGFGTYRYLPPARYLGAPPRANRLAAYNVYRMLREKLLTGAREEKHFYRDGAAVNAEAFRLLEAIGNDTFFLYLHYMEPHDPYFAVDGASYARVSTPYPDVSAAGAMRDAYRDGILRWDGHFAALLRGLAARGLEDNVRVIVTADHGEEFADHGGFWHGTTLYEEQLHVPLAMRGEGVTAGVQSALARQIDIAPTVLGFFGVAAPELWEGRDLRSQTPAPTRSLAEEDHEGNVLASVRDNGKKLIVANPGNPRGLGTSEIYDLRTDAFERKPLTDEASAKTLTTSLEDLKRDAKRGGASSATRPLDSNVESELRSLGYVK